MYFVSINDYHHVHFNEHALRIFGVFPIAEKQWHKWFVHIMFLFEKQNSFFNHRWKIVICSTKTSLALNFSTTQCYAYWKNITIRKPSCVVTAKFIFPYYKRKMKPNFKSFGSYNFLSELSTKDLRRYTSEGYSCNGLKWIYYIINDDCSFNNKYDNTTCT